MAKAKRTKKNNSGANLGFEQTLWAAADKMRGHMDSSEYKHVVLGLIFLKYISDAFKEQFDKIEADPQGDPEDRDEYTAENIFWVPKDARWSKLQAEAKLPSIGKTLDDAMVAIEKENQSLKGVLPKDYNRPALDKQRLGELIDLVGTIGLGDKENRSKDILGRVYEYFLSQFASREGRKGGEFYTPRCIVKLLVEMIEKVTAIALPDLSVSEKPTLKDEQAEFTGIIEILATYPINAFLTFSKSIPNDGLNIAENEISTIDWRNPTTIYQTELLRPGISMLEWLAEKLKLEFKVEGKIISPLWYQAELVRKSLAWNFADNFELILSSLGNSLSTLRQRLTEQDKPWLVAIVFEREIEYWTKIHAHVDNLSLQAKNIAEKQKIDGLDWPTINSDNWSNIITKKLFDLNEPLKKITELFTSTTQDWPLGFPDYRGRFIDQLGQISFESLLRNDDKLFKSVYSIYFNSCLMEFDRNTPKDGELSDKNLRLLKAAAAPVIEVLDLSGYARLISHLFDNEDYWEEVLSVWEHYIEGKEITPLFQSFVGAINLTALGLEMPHRFTVRVRWDSAIESLIAGETGVGTTLRYSGKVRHESALVRTAASHSYDGIDIFVEYYFKREKDLEIPSLGRKRDGFSERLAREEGSSTDEI